MSNPNSDAGKIGYARLTNRGQDCFWLEFMVLFIDHLEYCQRVAHCFLKI